jgi:predicted PurR-regulated permease PerM
MDEERPSNVVPFTGGGGLIPRLARPQVTARTVVMVLLTALLFVGALFLLYQLRQIVRWTIIAIFLAVALAPAVNWLERRGIKRGIGIGVVYVALLAVLATITSLIVPPLIDQVEGLVGFATDLTSRPGGLEQGLRDLAGRFGLGAFVETLRAQLSTLPSRLGAAAGPLLAITRGIVSSVTATISILLLTFFLLLDSEHFINAGLALLNPAQRPRLRRLLGESAGAIHGYINGNLIISLIAGVAAFLVMTIMNFTLPGGMPYAVVLALLVALLDLIPLVGATLGAAVVVAVGLFVGVPQGLILLVYFIVYQQVENNVLQPLVYGRSVQLHPLAIFLAVLAGGNLLGILGALLAIPVAEIIRIIGAEFLASRAEDTGGVVHGTRSPVPVEQVASDATTTVMPPRKADDKV